MLLNQRRVLRFALGALLLGALMLLLMAVDATADGIQWVDDRWRDLMVSARFTPLVWLCEAMAFIGSVWVNWPLRIAAMVFLAFKRRWLQLGAFALAVASSEVLIGTLKAAYARPRPPGSLMATSGFSFPSGHAIAGAVTAVGLVVCLLPPGSKRWAWEVRAAIFASLMALSRTYLRAHWLSDVVAGALIGTGLALLWPALLQSIRDRWYLPHQARRAAGPDPSNQPSAASP
ncbi:MAG: phosphatase PAP2 family protein [Actinomycetota bacterium]|nr:phosphatase PAP2 family protein [Actinomycetota bacterium]